MRLGMRRRKGWKDNIKKQSLMIDPVIMNVPNAKCIKKSNYNSGRRKIRAQSPVFDSLASHYPLVRKDLGVGLFLLFNF
jgi:hypothetical protein